MFKLLGVIAGALCLCGTSWAETWVKDPTRDCAVWSGDDGSAKEVMTWTGSCDDGKAMGLGVLVVHDKDGLAVVYNGEMREGKVDGIGSLKFRNDEAAGFDYYIGSFEDGKPVGNGLFDSSEGWSFQAYFEGSFDSGDGTLRVEEDNAVIRGEFVDGELSGVALASYETPTGEYYFGDIENGQRQGLFKDGKAHGMILVTKADGAQSIENWVDGEKQE